MREDWETQIMGRVYGMHRMGRFLAAPVVPYILFILSRLLQYNRRSADRRYAFEG
jgi:hypothetical protein